MKHRSDRPPVWPSVLAGILLMGLVTASLWVFFRPAPPLQPTAQTLSIVIPNDYYGAICLTESSAGASLPASAPIVVNAQGQGTIADVEIINRGFRLDVRRANGQSVPLVFDRKDVPTEGGVMFSDTGTGSVLALEVLRPSAVSTP